jgi:hypothetical protein
MQQVGSAGGKPVWFDRLAAPYDYAPPVGGCAYALLLVDPDEGVDSPTRSRLSQSIVRSGCRYALCVGPTGSLWDDSIDHVGILGELEGERAPFVMTTWHDSEPLEDTLEYFLLSTGFDEDDGTRWTPDAFVLVLLGGSDELESALGLALSRALAECFDS